MYIPALMMVGVSYTGCNDLAVISLMVGTVGFNGAIFSGKISFECNTMEQRALQNASLSISSSSYEVLPTVRNKTNRVLKRPCLRLSERTIDHVTRLIDLSPVYDVSRSHFPLLRWTSVSHGIIFSTCCRAVGTVGAGQLRLGLPKIFLNPQKSS